MYDRLVRQNIDIETTPLDMLEKALVQQKKETVDQDLKTHESTSMLQQVNRILQEVLPLKGINRNHLAIMLKNDIPANIQKAGALKRIIDNEFSIAKAIRELDKISQMPDVEKSGLGDKIKELLAFAKKNIPQTDLRLLKEGDDLSEIQNQLARKILLLEQQVKDVGAEWANSVRQLASNIRENIEVQNYLNRNDVFFQIPILLHDKIANLNVHVFNRNRRKKASMGDDSLDVVLNLETRSLGNLDINLPIQGNAVGVDIMMALPRDSKYLKSFGDMLSRRITNAGFKVSHINCKSAHVQTDYSDNEPTDIQDMNININSASRFEVSI